MDSEPACLDFAVIGHQDSWKNITALVNTMRAPGSVTLKAEKIKEIFSFIPPRDICKIKLFSTSGIEVNGSYIETFIDPDNLATQCSKTNVTKVKDAMQYAIKMGAGTVTLGGFTSIVLEGNVGGIAQDQTRFTTGNTLTAAFIVKGVEKAAARLNINLAKSSVLIIGATGDIGLACVHYFKHSVQQLLLCARNKQRLQQLAQQLKNDHVNLEADFSLQQQAAIADVIICVASSTGIGLTRCKKNVLICDAGYPKNLEAGIEHDNGLHLFHGGMGQVSGGYQFSPDYSSSMYNYPAPYISHGCVLEAVVLAFEHRPEAFSCGKGNISICKMEEIYKASLRHGVQLAPFFNAHGLWKDG